LVSDAAGRVLRRALAILLLSAWGGPALAQQQHLPNLPPTQPEFDELWKRFDRYCLQAFPDDAVAASTARDDGGKALTPPQLKVLLHDDPGSGWMIQARFGLYILTLERPPHHSCVVRKLFRVAPAFQPLLPDLVAEWAGGLDPPVHVTPLPATETKTTPPQIFYGYELRGPDGRVIETVGAFLAPIADSPQAELRLARMRGGK
jgi:hypothetical protein